MGGGTRGRFLGKKTFQRVLDQLSGCENYTFSIFKKNFFSLHPKLYTFKCPNVASEKADVELFQLIG